MVSTLTKGDVSDLAGPGILHAGHALQFQGRIVPKQDLRRILNSPTTSIDELLDEHLAKHTVRLLAEDGAKDDGYSVVTGLDVDGLLFAVMNRLNSTALLDALRRILRGVFRRLFLQLIMLIVRGLEWRSHGVALQHGELVNESIALLCRLVSS